MGLYEHIVCSGPPGLGDQAVRRETQASRVGEGEKEWGAEAPHPSSTRELLLASQLPPGGAVLWPPPTLTPRAWSMTTTGDSRG